jgi:hypothetical protein
MTKAERRAAMPQSTKFFDDMRNAFGMEGIAGFKAIENGHEIMWGNKIALVDGGHVAKIWEAA